jgi:hypothetical protein
MINGTVYILISWMLRKNQNVAVSFTSPSPGEQPNVYPIGFSICNLYELEWLSLARECQSLSKGQRVFNILKFAQNKWLRRINTFDEL